MPDDVRNQINELHEQISKIRYRHLEQMQKEIEPLLSAICDAERLYARPVIISQEMMVKMNLLNKGGE